MEVKQFIQNLIDFYEELLSKKVNYQNFSWASQKISVLKSINENALSNQQLSTVLETLLYAKCFKLMAGNFKVDYNENLVDSIKDIKNLDNIKEVQGKFLSEKYQGIEDFVFENLIRAWYNQKFNTSFLNLIKFKSLKNIKRCEFVIDKTENPQLIECKRVNSSNHLRENFRKNLKKAEAQFADTVKIKNLKNSLNHLLVDISHLVENSDIKIKNNSNNKQREFSFQEVSEEKIKEISSIFLEEIDNSNVDQLTLVSDKKFQVDKEPTAIIKNSRVIKNHEKVINFQGWTVVLGKGRLFKEKLKTGTIYSKIQPEDWLIAGQDGLDGNFFSQGPGIKTK